MYSKTACEKLFASPVDLVILPFPGEPAEYAQADHDGEKDGDNDVPEHLGIEQGAFTGNSFANFHACAREKKIYYEDSESDPDESCESFE